MMWARDEFAFTEERTEVKSTREALLAIAPAANNGGRDDGIHEYCHGANKRASAALRSSTSGRAVHRGQTSTLNLVPTCSSSGPPPARSVRSNSHQGDSSPPSRLFVQPASGIDRANRRHPGPGWAFHRHCLLTSTSTSPVSQFLGPQRDDRFLCKGVTTTHRSRDA